MSMLSILSAAEGHTLEVLAAKVAELEARREHGWLDNQAVLYEARKDLEYARAAVKWGEALHAQILKLAKPSIVKYEKKRAMIDGKEVEVALDEGQRIEATALWNRQRSGSMRDRLRSWARALVTDGLLTEEQFGALDFREPINLEEAKEKERARVLAAEFQAAFDSVMDAVREFRSGSRYGPGRAEREALNCWNGAERARARDFDELNSWCRALIGARLLPLKFVVPRQVARTVAKVNKAAAQALGG
jgi:hypothetical protein